jgi:hypothetical protein
MSDDYDTNPDAPTMEEIAEQLRHDGDGHRGIVSEADEVIGLTNNCVEVHHHACDGEIIIQLKPHVGWKMGDGEEGWMMSDEELENYTVYKID